MVVELLTFEEAFEKLHEYYTDYKNRRLVMKNYYKPIDDNVWLEGDKFEFLQAMSGTLVSINMTAENLNDLTGYCIFNSKLSQTLMFSSLGLSTYPYPTGDKHSSF